MRRYGVRPAGQSGSPEPALLLDENISGTRVHALLEKAGICAARFLDVLDRGASDEKVIAVATQLDLVIVSRDRDFRHHKGTFEAFKASNARVIWVVAKGAGNPDVLASLLIRARRRIAAFVASGPAPALARLDSAARLTSDRLR